MKLLFCPNCGDIFNITPSEVRKCRCGDVRGKYNPDGHTAVTNGNGFCLGINNNDLRKAIMAYSSYPNVEDKDYEFCRQCLGVEVWIRSHRGPSNPRSEVDTDL